jgi:hypothetical protein
MAELAAQRLPPDEQGAASLDGAVAEARHSQRTQPEHERRERQSQR